MDFLRTGKDSKMTVKDLPRRVRRLGQLSQKFAVEFMVLAGPAQTVLRPEEKAAYREALLEILNGLGKARAAMAGACRRLKYK